jgi:cell division protein FtsB
MFSVALFIFFLALIARWMITSAGGRGAPQLEAQHTAELARLREEVDALTAQVVSLQDEQSFMMRLLTDGGAGADRTAIAPPERSPEAPSQNPEIG